MPIKKKREASNKIEIRLDERESELVNTAATLERTTPTDFIKTQALLAAESKIHYQSRFVVTSEQWNAIEEALSQAPRVLPNLKKKLQAEQF